MGDRITVLFTGGEHFGGLAAARALAQAGFETVAADSSNSSYAARSRFVARRLVVPDPALGARPFVEALAAAAEDARADVVLPGTDVALLAVAAHRDLFPDAVAVGACPPETVRRATEKTALAELAAAAGIAVPTTRTIRRGDVDKAEAGGITFPAVVKTLSSDVADDVGALVHAGASWIGSPEELDDALDRLPGDEWLVQQYVEGELVAVAGVAADGALLAAVHQIADRIWPPDCGGSSYGRTIPPDAAREQKVRRLVAELGWTGIFQLQLLRRGDEEFLIDFNPRFYGTLGLALAAGVNLPRLWVEVLLERTPAAVGPYEVGVRYRAQVNDVRALASMARAGAWRAALRGLLPRAETSHPVVAWNDPLPVLAGWERVRRRAASAMAKTRRTMRVSGNLDKGRRKS